MAATSNQRLFIVIPTERSDEGSFTRDRLTLSGERSLSALGMTSSNIFSNGDWL